MSDAIGAYNRFRSEQEQAICGLLRDRIDTDLPEADSNVRHRHPVRFLDGSPIVGCSKSTRQARSG